MAFIADISCRKSAKDENVVHAVITGYDPRMCACCGGLMINFDGQTDPGFSTDYYLIKNDPASLGITANTIFPVHANVTWTLETPAGCGSKGFVRIGSIVIHK